MWSARRGSWRPRVRARARSRSSATSSQGSSRARPRSRSASSPECLGRAASAKAVGVSGPLTRRALMLSGDLTRTAEIAITEGEAGLRAIGFEIFRPIFPMLASTAASVSEAVASFDCSSVEWKLDGIRIQIHRRGDAVRIYTRNLNEITQSLPGIVKAVGALPVGQAVFDGEALWMND